LILKSGDLALANNLPGNSPVNGNQISPALVEAQCCFAEALAIAKQQQARSWELRTHLTMDRLAQRQGQAVHTQLAESYSWFSEGFETADLKQAKTRLDASSLS